MISWPKERAPHTASSARHDADLRSIRSRNVNIKLVDRGKEEAERALGRSDRAEAQTGSRSAVEAPFDKGASTEGDERVLRGRDSVQRTLSVMENEASVRRVCRPTSTSGPSIECPRSPGGKSVSLRAGGSTGVVRHALWAYRAVERVAGGTYSGYLGEKTWLAGRGPGGRTRTAGRTGS